jgi:hypothetical protein
MTTAKFSHFEPKRNDDWKFRIFIAVCCRAVHKKDLKE